MVLGVNWGRGRRAAGKVCDGGWWWACSYGDGPDDDGDGVAAENICQDASGLEEVALRWEMAF